MNHKLAALVGVGLLVGFGAAMLKKSARGLAELALRHAGVTGYRITSEIRTAHQQALAMRRKIELYGYSLWEFHELYRDDSQCDEVYPFLAAGDIEGATAVLQRYADAGRPISAHMRAGAVDVADVPPDKVAALRAEVEKQGGSVVAEEDHLHIQYPRAIV